jgi:hypothetical protein
MSYDLASFKKSSSSTAALTKALEATQKKFQKDERYWELSVDKAGNGTATIRFLDSPHVDGPVTGVPFVQKYSHGFKGPGGWYIENSLTTLGQGVKDPVSEFNSKLWNTGIEANKNIARAQKRQTDYISNILVIKDATNKDAEGKVFLFRYGPEIFAKIQERLPETHEEDKITTNADGKKVLVADEDFLLFNPYHFWEGANFKLKAKKKDSGYRTYADSVFLTPSALGKDSEIEQYWKASYSLAAEVNTADVKLFKPYPVLKARLDTVLGMEGEGGAGVPRATQSTVESALADEVEEATTGVEGDDPELEAFKRLANS